MLILIIIGYIIDVKKKQKKIICLLSKTDAIPRINACFKRSIRSLNKMFTR